MQHVNGQPFQPRLSRRLTALSVLALLLLTSAGCVAPDQPSMRLGSLPFPGPFSLYAVADPDNLGQHEYQPFIAALSNEASRGILYACRAGFLDLSHIRDSIDLTRHFYLALAEAVRKGKRRIVVFAFSPCRFHITLDLPDEWASVKGVDSLPHEVDVALIDLGAQLSWIATTWYEILQWAGYSSAILVPEGRSAFTYDDVIAHALGSDVARKALREGADAGVFSDAATRWLEHVLDEVEVVPQDMMEQAVELVRGEWWEGVSAIRRQLDIGLDDGTVRPWLVRGLDYCAHIDPLDPEPYPVPPLRDSLRPDGQPLAEIEIEMRIFETGRIRAAIPDRPRRIVPHRDFPHIMETIRHELKERYGENVDRPYEQW